MAQSLTRTMLLAVMAMTASIVTVAAGADTAPADTAPISTVVENNVATTITNDPRNPVPITVEGVGGSLPVATEPSEPVTTTALADQSILITTQYCSADATIFNPNLGLSTRFAGLVPTGKRLIIDMVSVYVTAPNGKRASAWVRAWNPLSPIKDEKHGRVFIPLTFQGNFDPINIGEWAVMDGTQAVRTFADAGWYIDVVFPTSAKPTSGSWTCQATISGHVVPKIAELEQQ